jgi:hypothetical protein
VDAEEYQAALSNIVGRLRPKRWTSTWTALRFLLGPRRISRLLAVKGRALADELAQIDPPADIAAEHVALVRAMREACVELDEVAARHGLRAFERFEAMAEANLAEAELSALEAKGYRLRD